MAAPRSSRWNTPTLTVPLRGSSCSSNSTLPGWARWGTRCRGTQSESHPQRPGAPGRYRACTSSLARTHGWGARRRHRLRWACPNSIRSMHRSLRRSIRSRRPGRSSFRSCRPGCRSRHRARIAAAAGARRGAAGARAARAPLVSPGPPGGKGPVVVELQPSIEATASAATSLIESMVFIFMPLGGRRTLAREARTVKVLRRDVPILALQTKRVAISGDSTRMQRPILEMNTPPIALRSSSALGYCKGHGSCSARRAFSAPDSPPSPRNTSPVGQSYEIQKTGETTPQVPIRAAGTTPSEYRG